MPQPVILAIKHLYVAFQDRIVLEDISLNVHQGDFLGILGPNGSGKTTLLQTIVGMVKPLSGDIHLFGKSPDNLGKDRQKIGYVPQQIEIDLGFPIKVRDVVMLGRLGKIGLGKRPKQQDQDAVDHCLDLVGMRASAGLQFGRLSGGQRQRVLIARALVVEPELLILDEPTTALDVASTESFYEWLHNTHKKLGLSLILVSHDVGVVSRYISAVACLNKRLVAHGLPDKVLDEQALQDMYGCEAVFFHHGLVPHMVVSSPKKEKGESVD